MAPICIFIGAMVTIQDGWPGSLPSYLPLQPCSPQLLSSLAPAQISKHQNKFNRISVPSEEGAVQ